MWHKLGAVDADVDERSILCVFLLSKVVKRHGIVNDGKAKKVCTVSYFRLDKCSKSQ
jgi:hypothetical protein